MEAIKAACLSTYNEDMVKIFLEGILKYYNHQIENILENIEDIYHAKCANSDLDIIIDLTRFVDALRTEIDFIFHIVDVIVNHEASSYVYDFLEMFTMKHLNGFNIALLIVRGPSFRVFCLNDILKIESLNNTASKVWVIECPVRAEMNPFEWPVLLHEAAHIIEREKIRVLEEVKEIYHLSDKITINYILEHICDFIAYMLIGPVFLFRLTDIHLSKEITFSETHPQWISRVQVLVDNTPSNFKSIVESSNISQLMGFIYNLLKNFEKTQAVQISIKPEILKNILKNVKEKMEAVHIDINELKECIERLKKFLPYTKDIIVLLNGGYLVYRLKQFSDYVTKYFGEDEYRLFSEFSYLISDCCRLTRIRRLTQDILSSSS